MFLLSFCGGRDMLFFYRLVLVWLGLAFFRSWGRIEVYDFLIVLWGTFIWEYYFLFGDGDIMGFKEMFWLNLYCERLFSFLVFGFAVIFVRITVFKDLRGYLVWRFFYGWVEFSVFFCVKRYRDGVVESVVSFSVGLCNRGWAIVFFGFSVFWL